MENSDHTLPEFALRHGAAARHYRLIVLSTTSALTCLLITYYSANETSEQVFQKIFRVPCSTKFDKEITEIRDHNRCSVMLKETVCVCLVVLTSVHPPVPLTAAGRCPVQVRLVLSGVEQLSSSRFTTFMLHELLKLYIIT